MYMYIQNKYLVTAIAGIVGVIGMCTFVAYLLLVPIGFSIISLIGTIVYLLIAFGFALWALTLASPGIAIALAVIYLFYVNYKLMRDFITK